MLPKKTQPLISSGQRVRYQTGDGTSLVPTLLPVIKNNFFPWKKIKINWVSQSLQTGCFSTSVTLMKWFFWSAQSPDVAVARQKNNNKKKKQKLGHFGRSTTICEFLTKSLCAEIQLFSALKSISISKGCKWDELCAARCCDCTVGHITD